MQHSFKIFYMPIGCGTTRDEYGFADVEVIMHGEAPDQLEIAKVVLTNSDMQPVELSETQFTTLFPGGHDIVNNAFEDAAQREVYEER